MLAFQGAEINHYSLYFTCLVLLKYISRVIIAIMAKIHIPVEKRLLPKPISHVVKVPEERLPLFEARSLVAIQRMNGADIPFTMTPYEQIDAKELLGGELWRSRILTRGEEVLVGEIWQSWFERFVFSIARFGSVLNARAVPHGHVTLHSAALIELFGSDASASGHLVHAIETMLDPIRTQFDVVDYNLWRPIPARILPATALAHLVLDSYRITEDTP
jgi:hypothetical protein